MTELNELRQQQIEHELNNRAEAKKRYEKQIEKEIARNYYSSTSSGRNVIIEKTVIFAEKLEEVVSKKLTQKISRDAARQAAQPLDKLINVLGATMSAKDVAKTCEATGKDEKQVLRDHGLYAVAMIA